MNKKSLILSITTVLFIVLTALMMGLFSGQDLLIRHEKENMKNMSALITDLRVQGKLDFAMLEKQTGYVMYVTDKSGKSLYESPSFKELVPGQDYDTRALEIRVFNRSTIDPTIIVYPSYQPRMEAYIHLVKVLRKGQYPANIWWKALATFALGSVLAILTVRHFHENIRRINRRFAQLFQDIARSDYSKPLYLSADSQFAEAAYSANAMSLAVQGREQDHNQQSLMQEAVFSSLATGIIAVDRQKNIIRTNAAAARLFLFDPEEVKGKNIIQVVRSSTIEDLIDHLLKSGIQDIVEEHIQVRHSEIRLMASPIVDNTAKIGVVLILEDVTEAAKLTQMRRDFVANVSHELKTPLTSIKGFTETMLDHEVSTEQRTRFLQIINHEVDRLNNLVTDLFVLSEIEKDEHSDVNKHAFDPCAVLHSIEDILHSLAERRPDIQYKLQCTARGKIYGNESLYKQMVVNLFENAVKYAKEEGGQIVIEGEDLEQQFVLRVIDHGIGIAPEDQLRIFERFYRADKSRSLNAEGTGLGLAIVKHTVISLGGTIEIKSLLDEGTTFEIRVPYLS